jgi:predicted MPP superfamily phosphohydrolase
MIDLVFGLLGGTVAVAGVHSTLVETRDLRVTRVDVPVADLPPELEGYSIAVLADLHHRPAMAFEVLRGAFRLAHDAKPDLIVLLGDYGSSFESSARLSRKLYERAMPALGAELSKLRAVDGVVAVLGNHDHYFDADRTCEWLRSLGIRVLVNDGFCIRRGDASLAIGGVDDVVNGTTDPQGGLSDVPNDVPSIVLAHNPDSVLVLAKERRVDLVLSGHTHGGQIVLPWIGAPVTFSKVCGRRTAAGWVPNERAPLYVSRGVGGQIPIRFNCPPELPIVRLCRG